MWYNNVVKIKKLRVIKRNIINSNIDVKSIYIYYSPKTN
jgi:hypothetical protein